MNFGDAIFKALTGHDKHPVSGQSMFDEIEQYRAAIGLSRRGFAKQSGIPESTLREWGKHGVTAKVEANRLDQITRAYRGLIASPAAVARWRANDLSIQLGGIPRTARTVTAGQLQLRAGTGAAAVQRFLAGDDTGAARVFAQGVRDPFYKHSVFGKWLPKTYDDLAYEGDGYDDADGYFATASAS